MFFVISLSQAWAERSNAPVHILQFHPAKACCLERAHPVQATCAHSWANHSGIRKPPRCHVSMSALRLCSTSSRTRGPARYGSRQPKGTSRPIEYMTGPAPWSWNPRRTRRKVKPRGRPRRDGQSHLSRPALRRVASTTGLDHPHTDGSVRRESCTAPPEPQPPRDLAGWTTTSTSSNWKSSESSAWPPSIFGRGSPCVSWAMTLRQIHTTVV